MNAIAHPKPVAKSRPLGLVDALKEAEAEARNELTRLRLSQTTDGPAYAHWSALQARWAAALKVHGVTQPTRKTRELTSADQLAAGDEAKGPHQDSWHPATGFSGPLSAYIGSGWRFRRPEVLPTARSGSVAVPDPWIVLKEAIRDQLAGIRSMSEVERGHAELLNVERAGAGAGAEENASHLRRFADEIDTILDAAPDHVERPDHAGTREILNTVCLALNTAMGEWCAVDRLHAPEWTHPLMDARAECEDGLVKLADPVVRPDADCDDDEDEDALQP